MSLGAIIGGSCSLMSLRSLGLGTDAAPLEYVQLALLGALLGSTAGALVSLWVGSPLSPGVLSLMCASSGAFLPYPVVLWLIIRHRFTADGVLLGMVLLFAYVAPLLGAVLGIFGARRLRGFGPRAARFAGIGLLLGLGSGGFFIRVMQVPSIFTWEEKTFYGVVTLIAAGLGFAACGAVWGAEKLHGRGFRLDGET
jgi:hypothetical protein